MFTIDLLPAARGDSLWIEYGDPLAPRRVLVDGGIKSTQAELRKRIERLPEERRRFDLLVITHIDLDHIAGILALLSDPPAGLRCDDIWFNGWEQLVAADRQVPTGTLGAKLGECISRRLRDGGYPWNQAFGNESVAIADSEKAIPRKTLSGGMTVRLLSPSYDRLRRLLPVWEKEIREAGLEPGKACDQLDGVGHPDDMAVPGILGGRIDVEQLAQVPFRADTSQANGSSIALVAEYGGKRCLLAGDAFAAEVEASVRRLIKEEGGGSRLELGALKLSHHGGQKSTSMSLLSLLDTPAYLFSTDGSVYGHPHQPTVARVLAGHASPAKPRLFFNYRSEETEAWDDKDLFDGEFKYEPVYPESGAGITVEL